MRMIRQLGREDWIAAGLRALATRGERALRIEPLARELCVTKGSFYWHFRDREAFCAALLDYWEHRAFAALARRTDRAPRAAAQMPLGRPAAGPPAPAEDPAASLALEHALRDWARRDVAAARAWARVQTERAAATAATAPKPAPGDSRAA